MLEGGIKHAYNRWRNDNEDERLVWRGHVRWLQHDKATRNETLTNERLYSLKMKEDESVESYKTRFYETSAGYRRGNVVLKSLYLNGTKPMLKAFLMGRGEMQLEETINAARVWAAVQKNCFPVNCNGVECENSNRQEVSSDTVI